MVKKYVCIPRSFPVTNVCNRGKTLCSPCILGPRSSGILRSVESQKIAYLIYTAMEAWYDAYSWTLRVNASWVK